MKVATWSTNTRSLAASSGAAADQAELTNVVTPSRERGAPQCDVYDEDCAIVGRAPRENAAAKNKALKDPEFPSVRRGAPVRDSTKRWFSCAAAPTVEGSPGALVAVWAIAAWVARRTRRRPQLAETLILGQ